MFSDDTLLAVPGQEGGPTGNGVALVDNYFGFSSPARIMAGFVCGVRNVARSLQGGSSQPGVCCGHNIDRWLGLTGGL